MGRKLAKPETMEARLVEFVNTKKPDPKEIVKYIKEEDDRLDALNLENMDGNSRVLIAVECYDFWKYLEDMDEYAAIKEEMFKFFPENEQPISFRLYKVLEETVAKEEKKKIIKEESFTLKQEENIKTLVNFVMRMKCVRHLNFQDNSGNWEWTYPYPYPLENYVPSKKELEAQIRYMMLKGGLFELRAVTDDGKTTVWAFVFVYNMIIPIEPENLKESFLKDGEDLTNIIFGKTPEFV